MGQLEKGVASILRRIANEGISAIIHEPDITILRNDQSIERRGMTCNGRYRQPRYPAGRTVNHAEPAWYNFRKPDAPAGVVCHREDLCLRIIEMVERDVTLGRFEMADCATGNVAEPDLRIACHREAERNRSNTCVGCGHRPGLDGASCRIKPPNPSTCRCGKPESTHGIELDVLWSQRAAIHGTEWEDAKYMLHGIKAPDIVCTLLHKPDVAVCVDCG